MKLLVLAQSTPPGHGQSRAVGRLVAALRHDPEFEVVAVEWEISRNAEDIGRWRLGKIWETLRIAGRVWRARWRHGPQWIYYVPAPGKRGALYRDWLLLFVARPINRGLILHWHAVGLGAWLSTKGTAIERALSQQALGGCDLAVAQSHAVRGDAECFRPKKCVVIPNGIPDPLTGTDFARSAATAPPGDESCTVIFVGRGCAEKGLFDAMDGVALANKQIGRRVFQFQALGPFASSADEKLFAEKAEGEAGGAIHWGLVAETRRNELLRAADIFCFPSYYPHEGQPAVLLEALAFDLPIVATRWRGIPENLPAENVFLVEARCPAQIAAALLTARRIGKPGGKSRAHFLANFTIERHHAALRAALLELS